MKSNRKEWLKRASALALGLFLVAMAGSVPAQRKVKRGPGNLNWGGSAQLRQTALQAGYNEGIGAGRADRQRGEQFNFKDESEYQSATKGYSSPLGDKALYQ